MAKSSPEKLAQALRANLKRRKSPASAKAQPNPPELGTQPPPKPSKKPQEKSA